MNVELADDLRPKEPELHALIEHVEQYRGKQLRPALVMLSGKAVGTLTADHTTVAKVVELIHTATLVHDDILDDASIRRQVPTTNCLHGNEAAVLLGDYIYARAFQLSVSMQDQACSRHLAEATQTICQGEIVQILHRLDFEWTEDQYYRVIADKTAYLYATACRLGGYYAGGDPEQLDALAAYGMQLGIAFQIVDDCLDLEGEEGVVGKSLGTDLMSGKLTLPLLHVLNERPDARDYLQNLAGQDDALACFRAEFDLDGAMAYSMEQARACVAASRSALASLPESSAREALEQIATFVVHRDQ